MSILDILFGENKMNEEKQPQESKEESCDEKHIHGPEGCREGTRIEKRIIHGSEECCGDGEKVIIKLPFGRKNLGAMKDFTMLKMINEMEGITGYDLGKLPDMPHGSVMRKLDELKQQGLLRSEEEESDGKKKVKYFITEEGKKHFDKLQSTFQETFSFLGDDMPFEHFGGPIIRKHVRKHKHFDVTTLETKQEVNDYLASMRHRLNMVKKRLQPRLDRVEKAYTAVDEAKSKIEKLAEFSKEEVKKIIDEIRDTYKDVWIHHPE